jgi:hypothetical protein
MSTIFLVLLFLADVAFFQLWLQKMGKERSYSLHVYRGERRFERVNDISTINAALECAEDWFLMGAEKIMICNEGGVCKRIFTRDDYEKDGSIYFA